VDRAGRFKLPSPTFGEKTEERAVYWTSPLFVSNAFAIASAFCMALSSMVLSELKGRVPLFQLARWQTLAAFLMTGLVSLMIGGWRTIGFTQFWLLAASSLAGIMIASTTYFATIYTTGPRVTALLFALTSPFALALGYLALGETISSRQGVGVALVLCGVALAIAAPRKTLAPDGGAEARSAWLVVARFESAWPRIRSLGPGIVLGVVTALGQALGSLFARPAMASGVEPFTGMALRSGLGALFFVALAAFPFAHGARSALKGDTVGLAVLSAFVGTALGMSFLLAALQQGNVGLVSTLSSMTPVVILPMVWIRSGKRPSAPAWLGALVAIAGTALIGAR
jgi:drug/metabolite transporter (DMT)-like permease